MITTGTRIKNLRLNKGWTQDELAEILKLSKSAISKWERDVNYPQGRDLKTLARLFDVSADFILGLTKDELTNFSNSAELVEILNLYKSLDLEGKIASKNFMILQQKESHTPSPYKEE